MGGFYLNISLLVLLLATLLGLGFWWMRRKEQQEDQAHAQALATVAASVGGVVVGSEQAAAWSAHLRAPMQQDHDGLLEKLYAVRAPRFETALDFRRGPWALRVTEASMKTNTSNGNRTSYEHRIDVATAPLPAMKLHRRLRTDFLGRAVRPDSVLAQGGPVRVPPVTVAQQQGQWVQVNLPVPVSTDWVAFGSDPYLASRALTPEALDWLARNAGALPWGLTFENGLLYATWPTRIQPGTLPTTVDAILGLLDRIPGARRA